MTLPGTIQSEIWTINTDTERTAIVRWDKMGMEFTYGIWYAKNPIGPWIRHNDIRLTDDIIDILRGVVLGNYYQVVGYNEYYINGLDTHKNYSIKIICDDRYDAWWYSQSAYDSIGGGLGSPHTRPSPDGKNKLGFQCYVHIP